MSSVKKLPLPCVPGDILFFDWGGTIREGVVKRLISFVDETRTDFRVELKVSVGDPLYCDGKCIEYVIPVALEPCGDMPIAYFTKTEALAARKSDTPPSRRTTPEEETSYDFDDEV